VFRAGLLCSVLVMRGRCSGGFLRVLSYRPHRFLLAGGVDGVQVAAEVFAACVLLVSSSVMERGLQSTDLLAWASGTCRLFLWCWTTWRCCCD